MLESFPHVTHANCRPTSDPTQEYNCVGWAVHSMRDFIWPDEREQFSWPIGIPRDESVGTMKTFFMLLGFAECDDGVFEPGHEKIALYAKPVEGVLHIARQLQSGRWTSKMGEKLDVEHSTADVLSDHVLGSVVAYMRRAWNGPPNLPQLYPPRPRLIDLHGAPLIR